MEELRTLTHAGNPDRTSRRVVLLRAMLDAGLDATGTATARAVAPSIALYAADAPAPQDESEALPDVPEWVELIPAPLEAADEGHIETRDWRRGFLIPDPQAIVDKFLQAPEERRALVLDWEHKSHRNWGCDRNPAAGWIEELQVRGKAIWGRIRWTPEGRDDVRLRRYRYISPVVSLLWPADSEGHIDWDAVPEATALIDAALTNCPATYIRDLASTPIENAVENAAENAAEAHQGMHSQRPAPDPVQLPSQSTTSAKPKEPPMNLNPETLSALGLPADATDAQINEAILKATKSVDARFEKIEAQLAAKDAEIAALTAGTGAASQAAREAQVTAVLSEYSDRFVPAEREVLATLGAEKGAEFIRGMLSTRVSLAHLHSAVPAPAKAGTGAVVLTEEEQFVCSSLGLDPALFLASKQKLEAAA